jgi:metal transporter CNNM
MAAAMSAARSRPGAANGPSSRVNMLVMYMFHAFAPMVKAIPLPFGAMATAAAHEELPKHDASLVLYLGIAIALVLAGGVFAGLTIAYAKHASALCDHR